MQQNKTYEPVFNNTQYNFSSRDCLGIESVAATISAELCPIVNTVTPRAFYWPFMVWIYYDFYKNSGITERDISVFDKSFLKCQDYYFVLATIIDKPADHPDQRNLVGKQNTTHDYEENQEGPYTYNPKYFKTRYGGMQYYNAGCLTMNYITRYDEKRNAVLSFPKLTQYGEEMAIAFENVIKDTEYYQKYRLKNVPIPKTVLEEYGNVINLGLRGFDECKKLLRWNLFESKRPESKRLRQSADYLLYINKEFGKHELGFAEARQILFDYFSPRGLQYPFPEDLQQIIVGWEVVIGRQYFTCGMEMIWKYMLHKLKGRLSFNDWAESVISSSSIADIRDDLVQDVIKEAALDHAEREQLISDARYNLMEEKMVENGLRIVLSIYNRFQNRSDLGEASELLNYGRGKTPGTGSISLNEWISLVEKFMDHTVGEFVTYVMKNCIVDQHRRTCYDKITRATQSVYGYYFEYIDGLYMRNEYEFQVDFQGIRLIQLMQVMTDLDMFEDIGT